jgi:ubiquinone biosynthesis accessory factor UbiJ
VTAPASETAGARGVAGSLIEPPLAAALNHLLRSASWAREQLKPYAGKAVHFDIAPFSATLEIRDNGEVAASAAEPAASFKLSPALGLRIAVADASAWREVDASGDMALAREILFIAQNLRWDVEEDLSRVFGDVIAQRLAGAGRALARWPRDSLGSLARQASVYWTEERPQVASRLQLDQFGRAVDTLRDDVERLNKRIEQLAGDNRSQR